MTDNHKFFCLAQHGTNPNLKAFFYLQIIAKNEKASLASSIRNPKFKIHITQLFPTHATIKVIVHRYRKVASSRLPRLVAHLRIFRLLMKGKFDAYVLCVTFGHKSSKLNSRPVDCSRLYGICSL